MKKKIILILVLVLLFLVLLTSFSQGQEEEQTVKIPSFIFGNNYLELSEPNKASYVAGLMDMTYYQTYYYDYELYSAIFDTISDMTGIQIKAIFDKYLEEHPEEWHMVAASIFVSAIMEIVNKNIK